MNGLWLFLHAAALAAIVFLALVITALLARLLRVQQTLLSLWIISEDARLGKAGAQETWDRHAVTARAAWSGTKEGRVPWQRH